MDKDMLFNYRGQVVNVVDGDTIDVLIDLGFDIHHEVRLRLLRINTAEMKSKSVAERAYAREAKQFVVDPLLDKVVYIHTEKSDVFGRYLAEIYVDDGETIYNFNDYMLQTGMARKYER